MKLRILFFASARELTGETEAELDISEGTMSDAVPAILMAIYPDLDMQRDRMSLAINQVYCREPTLLRSGDVLAVLPPISGG